MQLSDMLYDLTRHSSLQNIPWSEKSVVQVIEEIFNCTLKGMEPPNWWKSHPDEDGAVEFNKGLYSGAAGVLWGLKEIEKEYGFPSGLNYSELIDKDHADYLKDPDTQSVVPSFTLGETGILLLKYLWNQNERTAESTLDRLQEVLESNIRNPVNEALWGAPGTMMAALFLYQKLGADRWKNLFLKNCDYLFETWNYPQGSTWVWQQDLYGKICRLAGAGHGFVGNVFPLLEGAELLNEEQRNLLYERTRDVVLQSAKIENGQANWFPYFEQESPKILMQWCHGAPGFITSLRSFPKNFSAEFEKVLEMAGEATWQAGPLNKGVGICHGTDGNGWAFLTLYKRTGNSMWLERARAFAMHAITQRNGRFSLWTGEIGLATYLMACISLDDRIPTLGRI